MLGAFHIAPTLIVAAVDLDGRREDSTQPPAGECHRRYSTEPSANNAIREKVIGGRSIIDNVIHCSTLFVEGATDNTPHAALCNKGVSAPNRELVCEKYV